MAFSGIKDLTPEEAKKVDAAALPEASRPFYYNASSGTLQKISNSFEIFLILTPIGVRTSLANFFTVVTGSKGLAATSDRNSLLEDWLDNEIKDLGFEVEAYDEITSEYTDLKAKLVNVTTGFESVDEVNKMVADLNKSVGNYAYIRDGLAFMKTVATVIKNRTANGELPESMKQEINSWIKVLLTYP